MNTPLINATHYIDSHCHLDFARVGKVNDVVRDAKAVGVARFIVPSVSSDNWLRVLELGQNYEEIYPALGIHPYFLSSNNHLEQLIALAGKHRDDIVAIGEIGLDGAIDTPINEQLSVLIPQLKLAADSPTGSPEFWE